MIHDLNRGCPVLTVIEGLEVVLRRGGPRASTLVFLHGIGSNRGSFSSLVDALPQRLGLVMCNTPGYGASRSLADPTPQAQDYARRLIALLDACALDQVVLVGHSLGTLIATALAARHPERVRGLVLLACAQGYGRPPGELDGKSQDRLDALQRLGRQAFAEERAPGLLHAPDSKPELKQAVVAAMARINPEGYTQAVHMLASGDLASDAAQCRCPSLLVLGGEDRITPLPQSQAVQAALEAAAPELVHRFVLVPEAGHAVHQEAPALVATAIARFVRDLEKKREAA